MKTKGLILALSLLATFTINAAKIKGNEKITTQEFKVDILYRLKWEETYPSKKRVSV
jgi:hypothetical protein